MAWLGSSLATHALYRPCYEPCLHCHDDDDDVQCSSSRGQALTGQHSLSSSATPSPMVVLIQAAGQGVNGRVSAGAYHDGIGACSAVTVDACMETRENVVT